MTGRASILYRNARSPSRSSSYVDVDFVVLTSHASRFDRIVEPLLSEHGEESSENRHRETSIHRALNADVAGARELPHERWGVDVFSEGGGVGVLDEDAEESCGCLCEIFFDILLEADGERSSQVENNPAYSIPLDSFHIPHEFFTHEDQRRVQVLVALVRLPFVFVTKFRTGSRHLTRDRRKIRRQSTIQRSPDPKASQFRRRDVNLRKALTSWLAFHPEVPW